MFQGNEEKYLLKQYGMGFTITNRVSIAKKHKHSIEQASQYICQKYYDFIVYGSIWRCDLLLDLVLQYYKKDSIAFIDGEDFDFGVRKQYRVKGLIKLPKFYSKWRDKAIMMAIGVTILSESYGIVIENISILFHLLSLKKI